MSLEEDYYNLLDVYKTEYQNYKKVIEPLIEERKDKYKKYHILAKATISERFDLQHGMQDLYCSFYDIKRKLKIDRPIVFLNFSGMKHNIPTFPTDYCGYWDPENKERFEFDQYDIKNNGMYVVTQNDYNQLLVEISDKRHQYKMDIKYVKEDIEGIDKWNAILIVYKDIIVIFQNAINNRFVPIIKQGNKRVPEELYFLFLKYAYDFYKECFNFFENQVFNIIWGRRSFEEINDKCQKEMEKINKMIYRG